MEFLKAQFTRISEQLAGLSATQKMLVFTLLTIMVMTMMWWSHWAAEPEMSPLLNQSMTTEEVGQIAANLQAQGIPHQVSGDKVLVPMDRRMEILSTLGYSQALPKNFDSAFSDIIKQMNWLDPPDKTDQMFLQAKEQTLAEMIRGFPGVSDAVVVIDPSTKRDIGGNDVQPVATVTISTGRSGNGPSRQLAESAAKAVCGAIAGLSLGRINVIIDGASFPIKDHSDDAPMSGDESVEMQKRYEDYYSDKINKTLEDIRGVMVSVTVKLDTSRTTTTIHKVDPKQTVSVPTRTEEQTQDTTGQPAALQEPGAVPNTGMDLSSGGGGGGGNSNTSSDKNEFNSDFGKQDEVINQGAGTATVATASVRIPRSYFVQAYKNENGGADPSDPSALSTYINNELLQIKNEVKGCAVFPSDDALFVGTYSDVMPPALPVALPAAGSPITGTLTKNAKEIGIGALAVISLFMVSMMVKKGSPPPVAAPAGAGSGARAMVAEGDAQSLDGNETIVGSAAEKNAALDGVELDEETVKAQQTLEQVQQMVQANPDAAASLVKRWLNR
jgi:flagellar biosynthesis/type III secretory pathway M-ring protein FliF/YscJ